MKITNGIAIDPNRDFIKTEKVVDVSNLSDLEDFVQRMEEALSLAKNQISSLRKQNTKMKKALRLVAKPCTKKGEWNMDRDACCYIAKIALE